MLLKLTLERAGVTDAVDVAVDADPTTTIGDLARALLDRDPRRAGYAPAGPSTIRVELPDAPLVLDPDATLADASLASGDRIAVQADGGRYIDGNDHRAPAATLVVRTGPDEGRRFELRSGANQAGRERSSDVVLTDAMVSKRHARFNVTDVLEVLDLGSANGVFVSGEQVQRATLRVGDSVTLGDTEIAVESMGRRAGARPIGPVVSFNRSPYLDPVYPAVELPAPEPPGVPKRQRFPVLSMLAPLLMGVALYAFTREIISVLFIALSPIMLIGTWIEGKRTAKLELKDATEAFRANLADLSDRVRAMQVDEVAGRLREHPGTADVLDAAGARSSLLWARRPDRHGFGEVRLGIAALPSRVSIQLPNNAQPVPELWQELLSTVRSHAMVAPVPVVGSLSRNGVIGVAGALDDALGAARALVAQLAVLHSPAELVIAAAVSSEHATHWDWLKWLPHTTSPNAPFDGAALAVGSGPAASLASALRGLIDERLGEGTSGSKGPSVVPSIVLVVDDAVPVDRSVLVELAERGAGVGVHLLWVAPTVEQLPAAAEVFLAIDPATHQASAGFIDGGHQVLPVDTEPLDGWAALDLARSLSCVVDAGARDDDGANLPGRVSFLEQVGLELAESHDAVIDRWRMSDSLPSIGIVSKSRRKAASLHALVGSGAHGPMQLDLRSHGPHALVGGTTGAGKSEFLQSWILGMAANHSPHRVTFLFVDYKGGAAFSECVDLPHSVGMVTDLTPHLVQRALTSLNAELRHREEILNLKRAKDVLELEKVHDPDTPPSLVIVVDEFAALATEVPEFVDGMVNVAQRGRSLGLHLILATQRPAGVIKDNLRANTNLRVALRMADESDSTDVVGSEIAAGFSADVPGRGAVKLGPGRLHPFQAAYVGGWTTGEAPPPRMALSTFVLGSMEEWPEPEVEVVEVADRGPNDLSRLVTTMGHAAREAGLGEPRKPWLPELEPTYDLGRSPSRPDGPRLISRVDDSLVFGVLDDPARQAQRPVAFEPDRDGNMLVVGAGGSGKSALLRTLAIAGSLSTKGGPCHVYGLDFASRGLAMLEPLPNVGAVISGDDDERVRRLLRTLRATIDERVRRYSEAGADSITKYRRLASAPDEARILVLLDGFPSFRSEYEVSGSFAVYDMFQSIALDGRQAGVHVVVTADRVGAIPSALASTIQRRIVFRLANDEEYAFANVPAEAFPQGTPPGRGFFDGREVQVAVLGGDPSVTVQAQAIARLAEMAAGRGVSAAAPIGRLADNVEWEDLHHDGAPGTSPSEGLAFALADETLAPLVLHPDGPLAIVGPPRSGKTTAMVSAVVAAASIGAVPEVYVGAGRSDLARRFDWRVEVVPGEHTAEAIEVARSVVNPTGPVVGEGWRPPPGVLVVDGVPAVAEWLEADDIAQLVSSAVDAGWLVLGDGAASDMSNTYGLVAAMTAGRSGFCLMPDPYDGEGVFKTALPTFSRAAFPPGRGFYVAGGRTAKVQVARPPFEVAT
ncbi:MAG: FHA domain-containing protein [Actinobacteria bacterium]|nr:FHA domain-containing protein [Actinomycetota bacterium]